MLFIYAMFSIIMKLPFIHRVALKKVDLILTQCYQLFSEFLFHVIMLFIWRLQSYGNVIHDK